MTLPAPLLCLGAITTRYVHSNRHVINQAIDFNAADLYRNPLERLYKFEKDLHNYMVLLLNIPLTTK